MLTEVVVRTGGRSLEPLAGLMGTLMGAGGKEAVTEGELMG